jgi:hypothetical protein
MQQFDMPSAGIGEAGLQMPASSPVEGWQIH